MNPTMFKGHATIEFPELSSVYRQDVEVYFDESDAQLWINDNTHTNTSESTLPTGLAGGHRIVNVIHHQQKSELVLDVCFEKARFDPKQYPNNVVLLWYDGAIAQNIDWTQFTKVTKNALKSNKICSICKTTTNAFVSQSCTECYGKNFCKSCVKSVLFASRGESSRRPICIICVARIKREIDTPHPNPNYIPATATAAVDKSVNAPVIVVTKTYNSPSEVYDWRNAAGNPCSRCGCRDDRMCFCC